MTRRTVSLDNISVPGLGLRRVTRPALEMIKYLPISVDVGSYHKPDDEDRVSLWVVCFLEKNTRQRLVRDDVCCSTYNVKSWKITRMQVNA